MKNPKIEITHKALAALYASTDGDYWEKNAGWNTKTAPENMDDFNSWHGLTVSDGKLVEIRLSMNGLYGELPPEIGDLSDLELLDLNTNPFFDIPPEVGRLFNLKKLDMSDNKLMDIPREIGDLSNLESLDFGNEPAYKASLRAWQAVKSEIITLGVQSAYGYSSTPAWQAVKSEISESV